MTGVTPPESDVLAKARAQLEAAEAEYRTIAKSLAVCRGLTEAAEAEVVSLRTQLEERQRAIDVAMGAMRESEYVGGPTEREAWRAALSALGPFETQHQAVALPSTQDRTGNK